MNTPFELSISSEMVFTDLPHIERVKKIHELGFSVEIWDWTQKDAEALAATGANFTSMTGYITGRLTDNKGSEELINTALKSISFAKKIGNPGLNLHGTGLGEGGLPVQKYHEVTGQMWIKAHQVLCEIAELAEKENVIFLLENLNTEVDHPHTPFAKASDTLALVSEVGSPHLKMNLDLYHAQIGEGNLIEIINKSLPYIGEIQVADVPGRCEPGTGEINYRNIAIHLAEIGYTGVVGLESFAKSDSLKAVEAFRQVFSF